MGIWDFSGRKMFVPGIGDFIPGDIREISKIYIPGIGNFVKMRIFLRGMGYPNKKTPLLLPIR